MIPTPAALRLLAAVLEYPRPDAAARAAACAEAILAEHPAAALRLARFAAFALAAGADALEETYTAAFDLAPTASPYVGDQLFGASAERGRLLAGLRGLAREAGVPPGPELPDHVAEVLRLAAAPIPPEVRDDLVRDGLAPALAKMQGALEAARSPWADPVAAAAELVASRAEAGLPAAQEVSP